ncbi:MAG: hypothetical protein NC111_04705 [Bacteroides sp.]|nr:hypothetical protein [Bacteroides sp.]MCM1413976.1 hypothetical protein [Bacteroides sp.]MCM1471807.1 hypothetical protein [Bacteroides sp.]
MPNYSEVYDTQEQPVATARSRRLFSIGLPVCHDAAERRFPLTPEGAAMLVDQGFNVWMESGAASTIHYTDAQYANAGVRICPREQTLRADIVMHLAPLSTADIAKMRRGAMLLTLSSLCRLTHATVNALLDRSIITIAIDLIRDERGYMPFADILSEIDGRAAIARAMSLLADSIHGKGILLGGVAGIVPCEVTIIGSGIAACAAARSSQGAGALVRMFDHDVYRLRHAERMLQSGGVVTSALHPRVLLNALRTADVVVYTGVKPLPVIDADDVRQMKRGVIIFDLTADCGKAFPSVPTIDLALASPLDISLTEPSRACYINAGSAAARTAAMALSNTFNTMMRDLVDCEGLSNALKLLPGMQCAALTFLGKAVNAEAAAIAGCRHVDINLFLSLS